jgi:hypothetical protein
VRERQTTVDRLESSLQSETDQRRREESAMETLKATHAEVTDQLAGKVLEQQRWQQREAELEKSLRRQKDQIASAAATATAQEAELKRLRNTVQELQVLQSTLCARVQDLTRQHDAACHRVRVLDGESKTAAETLLARNQEIAALRHAILDAARIAGKINRERLEVDCQVVDGWKRLITTLLHTPLSITQRGLVTDINNALDGWRKSRAHSAHCTGFQVEAPDLRRTEFNCSETIASALAVVRKQANADGKAVEATLVGQAPDRLHGNARYVHQLITLLAASLPGVTGAEALDLRVAFETGQAGSVAMHLELVLSSTSGTDSMHALVTAATTASSRLLPMDSEGPELALAAAWQLALALGARPVLETTAEGKLRVQLSVPLVVTSTPEATTDATPTAADVQVGAERLSQSSGTSPAGTEKAMGKAARQGTVSAETAA